MEPGFVREALEACGANFEIGEKAKQSLGEYTNKGKGDGLRAVWGAVRVAEFKEWLDGYVIAFEATKGNRKLLTVRTEEKTGKISFRKNAGMLQFLGEFTAFAARVLSFDDYTKYTEARALNGRLWQEGRPIEDLVRIELPTKPSLRRLASFPPGFPSRAWSKLKEWRTA